MGQTKLNKDSKMNSRQTVAQLTHKYANYIKKASELTRLFTSKNRHTFHHLPGLSG